MGDEISPWSRLLLPKRRCVRAGPASTSNAQRRASSFGRYAESGCARTNGPGTAESCRATGEDSTRSAANMLVACAEAATVEPAAAGSGASAARETAASDATRDAAIVSRALCGSTIPVGVTSGLPLATMPAPERAARVTGEPVGAVEATPAAWVARRRTRGLHSFFNANTALSAALLLPERAFWVDSNALTPVLVPKPGFLVSVPG